MATWTQAEWATASLVRLGIVAAGQAASAEDQTLANDKAGQIYPQLRRKGLAPFAVATIPEGVQDQLEAILAYKLTPHFGITPERKAIFAAEARQAMHELAAFLASDKHQTPIEVEDF